MNRLVVCFWLATLTGCSFVVTEKDIAGPKEEFATFEPRLLGDWQESKGEGRSPAADADPQTEEFVRLERASADSKALLIRTFKLVKAADGGASTEVQEAGTPLVARVVNLGDLMLASIGHWPKSEGFLIARLTWVKEGFTTSLMDPKFFEKNPTLVAHRMDKKEVIITADVEAMHEFFRANGKRRELWQQLESPPVIQRRKAGTAR